MFIPSIASFAIAAVLGLTLAVRHFTHKEITLPLALAHGLFAAAGLALLLTAGLKASFPAHTGLAAGLFVVTALGGAALFAMQLAKRTLLSALIAVHGGAAVVSFLLLLTSAFSG